MDDLIFIDAIEKNGHDDLDFSIPGLTGDLTFDTYYFGIAAEPYTGFQDVKHSIAKFLGCWVTHIERMQDGQTGYFPIDISDQYTGCIRIEKQAGRLCLAYGFSRHAGYELDIHNPAHYFGSITDFESHTPETIIVSPADFLSSLKQQITRLSG